MRGDALRDALRPHHRRCERPIAARRRADGAGLHDARGAPQSLRDRPRAGAPGGSGACLVAIRGGARSERGFVKILVIGAGAAGTACAWFLGRAGAKVTLVHDRAGATALFSGALDQEPSVHASGPLPVDADMLEFAKVLTGWVLGARPCRIATRSGA